MFLLRAVVTAGIALFFFKKANMGDFKRISELIDTYYPEISERLRNGKRDGK